MIVYLGSANTVCDLSMVAVSLMNEGFSNHEVVLEIIDYCESYGLLVHKYDVEMMIYDHAFDCDGSK